MTVAQLKMATTADEVKSALAGATSLSTAQLIHMLEAVALEAVRAREEVRSSTRVREVLLASVAHDLRNPLNTFAMSTGLLRDDLESPDFERSRAVSLVSRMERASTRMQRLIEDLLEASRIEAASVDIAKKSENAAVVLRAAIEKAKPLATDKGASIEESTVDETITADLDRARVIEAISKMVSVALKSTGEGGIIRLGVEKRDSKVAFSVRGVAPRATKSTAPDESRGGLALLIARGIVTAHGGTITTDTTPDGGRSLIVL